MTENEKNEDYSYRRPIIKVILLGNTDTGKTSLINAYEGKQFTEETLSTFGSQFIKKDLEIDQKIYNVQIWDTAGQEQFRSVNKIYIKGSHVVLFVYDVTNEKSFTDLKEFWVDYVDKILGQNMTKGLIGNKIDLMDSKIDKEDAQEFAEKIGAFFSETSAKEHPKGIIDLINKCVEDYVSKHAEELEESLQGSFSLRHQKSKKNKKNKKKNKNKSGIYRVEISNIDKDVDEKALKELFGNFNCENLKIFRNQNGLSNGMMDFIKEEDANNCVEICNNVSLGKNNRKIHLKKISFDF